MTIGWESIQVKCRTALGHDHSAFCICVSACVSLFMCMCIWVHMNVTRGWHWVPSLIVLYPILWDRVAHWTWSLSIWLTWLATKPQGYSSLCLPGTELLLCAIASNFLSGFLVIKLSLHEHMANTYQLTEPSSQAQCFIFFIFILCYYVDIVKYKV